MVTLHRVEARFVARYRQTLPNGQDKRLRLAVDWTDLYIVEDADLIEAKRSAAHRYVRDARAEPSTHMRLSESDPADSVQSSGTDEDSP